MLQDHRQQWRQRSRLRHTHALRSSTPRLTPPAARPSSVHPFPLLGGPLALHGPHGPHSVAFDKHQRLTQCYTWVPRATTLSPAAGPFVVLTPSMLSIGQKRTISSKITCTPQCQHRPLCGRAPAVPATAHTTCPGSTVAPPAPNRSCRAALGPDPPACTPAVWAPWACARGRWAPPAASA